MITYGYFNSVDGDRVYNADDMSNYFEGIITDGVYKQVGQGLEVAPQSGMTVKVGTGKAIISNKWIKNTTAVNLTIENNTNANARYDAIILKCDLSTRSISIEVKKGTPAVTPAKPEMTNSAYIKEMCLAYIYVAPNVTSIGESIIEDTRENNSVCGWVQALVGSTVRKYQNHVKLTSDSSTISIGIDKYNPLTDTLLAYANGLLLTEVEEYLVNGTGSQAYIDLAYPLKAGNECTFIVFKSEAI